MATISQICSQIHAEQWGTALPLLLSFTDSHLNHDDENLFIFLHSLLRVYFYRQKGEAFTACKTDHLEFIYRIYSSLIVKRSVIESPICIQLLDDLSSLLFFLSSKRPASHISWSTLSEECCLAITTMIENLFNRLSSGVIPAVYTSAHFPLLGHICSTLLEFSEYSCWRAVRKSALRGLAAIANPPNAIRHQNEILAKAMANFFPGTSQTLYRIITGDSKIGSGVKAAALDAWRSVLVVVFHQFMLPKSESRDEFASSEPALFSAQWYESARSHTADLISRTIDNLLHVQLDLDLCNAHRISDALIRWLSQLLSDCPALLRTDCGQRIRDMVISALVLLVATNYSTGTANEARDQLARFISTMEEDEDPQLHVMLPCAVTRSRLLRKITVNALCDHITSMSSITDPCFDEDQLRKRLRTAVGYLTLLDSEGLSVLASNRDMFHRLCTSLAELLCFNTGSIEIFNDCLSHPPLESAIPPTTANETLPLNLFSKSFETFRDPKTLEFILTVVAQLAGQESTFDLFVDTCRDLMTQFGRTYRNSSLLLITAAVAGFISNTSIKWYQRHLDSLRLITEYFESDLLRLPISNTPEKRNCDSLTETSDSPFDPFKSALTFLSTNSTELKEPQMSLKELKENAISICILLELFATASQLYRFNQCKENIQRSAAIEELLRIGLLSVTCRAADPGIVGQTADNCLRYVSGNCGYTSVDDLISENADFIVSSITLDLHRFLLLSPDETPFTIPPGLLTSLRSTCHILETLFRHATINVIPIVRPLIRQVLQCLDLTYEQHSGLFLPALHYLMKTCRQWHKVERGCCTGVSTSIDFVPPAVVASSSTSEDVCASTIRNIQTLIAHTRRVHLLPVSLTALNTNVTSEIKHATVDRDPDDSPHVYPDYLHIVEETMLRCIHLMANSDPKLRLLSIDVLMEGFQTLAEENELLLPLVHKVWMSLMCRFRDHYAVVVEKAFQLLLVLVRVAGGFLRSRASSEIMSPLLNFMIRGSYVSAGASDSYRHLTSYRVQKLLLMELGKLCTQLGLSSEALRPVVQMLTLYLADDQPRGLQQASEHSLCCLWSSDPGLVWATLIRHVSATDLHVLFSATPSGTYQPLQISDGRTENGKIDFRRIKGLLSRMTQIVPTFDIVV